MNGALAAASRRGLRVQRLASTATVGRGRPRREYPDFAKLSANLEAARAAGAGQRLSAAEKILLAHRTAADIGKPRPVPGETYLQLRPDRVAMQDASAQVRRPWIETHCVCPMACACTLHGPMSCFA